jgi:hypothetical protein
LQAFEKAKETWGAEDKLGGDGYGVADCRDGAVPSARDLAIAPEHNPVK